MTTLERSLLRLRPPDRGVPTRVDIHARQGRWAFFGEGSLPSDPLAREHEKRGRKWLVVSYLFCPCHLPLVMVLLGAAFGGTALGAALTGNALRVGIVLTMIYALVLWRGFRQIRRAKRIEAAGGTLSCTPAGCSNSAPSW